jgi:hypothetical protein
MHAVIRARGRSSVQCVVCDLAEGSALLQVDQPAWLPPRFQITIEATGTTAECEVTHRTADAVGVRFVGS